MISHLLSNPLPYSMNVAHLIIQSMCLFELHYRLTLRVSVQEYKDCKDAFVVIDTKGVPAIVINNTNLSKN